jgi:hypothetical protein
MISPRTAFASLLILAAVATAACGVANASNSHADGQPVVVQTSSASTQGSQTSAVPDDQSATDTEAHPAQRQDGYPRVLWMFVDDSNPDVSIVHFASNVPTTASLYQTSVPGHPLHRGPAEDLTLAKEHAISLVPGPNGAFNLQVLDVAKNAAYAQLRTQPIVADAYFVEGTGAPKLTLGPGLHGVATWETQLLSIPRPASVGAALVFENAFGCTRACSYAPVSTGGDQPVSIDRYTDQHTVGFMFPDRTHDYVVVVGGVSEGEHGSSDFYQFEVSGSGLPR